MAIKKLIGTKTGVVKERDAKVRATTREGVRAGGGGLIQNTRLEEKTKKTQGPTQGLGGVRPTCLATQKILKKYWGAS